MAFDADDLLTLDGVLCAISIQSAFAAFNAERSGADVRVARSRFIFLQSPAQPLPVP